MRKLAMTLILTLHLFPSGAVFAEDWPMPLDSCDLEARPATPTLILVLAPPSIGSTCPAEPSVESPELVEERGPVSGVMIDLKGKFNRPWTAEIGPDSTYGVDPWVSAVEANCPTCNGIPINTNVDLNSLVSLLQSIMLCGTDELIE